MSIARARQRAELALHRLARWVGGSPTAVEPLYELGIAAGRRSGTADGLQAAQAVLEVGWRHGSGQVAS